jgi:hypothetical protein
MNRRTLLAIILAAPLPAAAQVAVIDPTHIARTVAEGVKRAQEAKQQYDQLVSTYRAIASAGSLSGLAGALGGMSRSSLPQPGETSGYMAGTGGTWGQGQAMLDQARRYRPEQDDDYTREMDRRETVTANARALALSGMEDAQRRIENLDTLYAELNREDISLADAERVNGMIAIEQQGLAAHRGQTEQIRLMLAADDRVTAQRAEQAQRESADDLMRRTRPMSEAGW